MRLSHHLFFLLVLYVVPHLLPLFLLTMQPPEPINAAFWPSDFCLCCDLVPPHLASGLMIDETKTLNPSFHTKQSSTVGFDL